MLAHGFPSRAILASLFLATRTAPPCFACARTQILHFSNCKTGVVGYHNDARAFKDLAEFLDQLVLFVLYPQFHSKFGDLSPAQFRAEALRVLTGSVDAPSGLVARARMSLFPSRAGFMTLRSPTVLGRMHEVRRIAPGCAGVRLEGLLAFVKGEVQCARMAELSPL